MRLLSVAVAMALAASLATDAGSTANAAPDQHSAAKPARHQTVTLLSGDQVSVSGDQVQFRPGAGRQGRYRTWTNRGQTYVAPEDAIRLIAEDTLDQRLFNVTGLIAQGYTRGDIPVMVGYRAGTNARSARPTGLTSTRPLPAVGGEAATVSRAQAPAFWRSITSSGNARARSTSPIKRVWLDGKVTAHLDRSTAQIGAPAAWKAGLDGKDVPVAVLDTGYDQAHPDLKTVVTQSQDFTASAKGVQDTDGHGTHVASTVAGSGAASNGRYRGVAPGAKLAVGKVLADGEGQESWVIAGMEWAATRARVVNMSLGGYAHPEQIDPLEQAVNDLTAKHGTLFVVAAGNTGNHPGQVGSPGTADAALTVGSVNRKDQLNKFSSFGPRLRDGAPKPDVTAPGDGVVAARAKGTLSPERVGIHYARLSGTSMASPHVAGAAAVLAQAHPGWKAPQLKAALMASAVYQPGTPVHGQGAGRIDIPAALKQQVTAATPSVSLKVEEPYTKPANSKITYRNGGKAPVTLKLAVESADADGKPDGKLALSAKQLTVPAGGTATATVSGRAGSEGTHAGRVTATASGVNVSVPVTIASRPKTHVLRIKQFTRTGQAYQNSPPLLVDLDRGSVRFLTSAADGSYDEARVPTGRYRSLNVVVEEDAQVQVVSGDILVSQDRTVEVRPSNIRPVRAELRGAKAELGAYDLTIVLGRAGVGSSLEGAGWLAKELVGTPEPPGTPAPYTVEFRAAWAAPNTGYLLSWESRGRPVTEFHAEESELAAVRVRQHTSVPGARNDLVLSTVPSATPWAGAVPVQVGRIATGSTHTVKFNFQPDVEWHLGSVATFEGSEEDPLADYSHEELALTGIRPGARYEATFGAAPFGPAFTRAKPLLRVDNWILGEVPLFSPGQPGYVGEFTHSYSGKLTLLRGNQVRDSRDLNPMTDPKPLTIQPYNDVYTLRATASRKAPWTLSTKVDTAWTFRSKPGPDDTRIPLPLLTVRYVPVLDVNNATPGGTRFTVPFRVERQEGSGELNLAKVGVEVSYDDGKTWTAAPVTSTRAGMNIALDHPKGPGYVSLRATVVDRDGSKVVQTVIRAYALR